MTNLTLDTGKSFQADWIGLGSPGLVLLEMTDLRPLHQAAADFEGAGSIRADDLDAELTTVFDGYSTVAAVIRFDDKVRLTLRKEVETV